MFVSYLRPWLFNKSKLFSVWCNEPMNTKQKAIADKFLADNPQFEKVEWNSMWDEALVFFKGSTEAHSYSTFPRDDLNREIVEKLELALLDRE